MLSVTIRLNIKRINQLIFGGLLVASSTSSVLV
jgi:hypothetical protein